jgi:hypothetical protein
MVSLFYRSVYSQFAENSMLEKKTLRDKSEPYDLIYTDDNGDHFKP